MHITAKVGGRRVKGDSRDCRDWCGKLELQATREGDQFLLAALYRALTTEDNPALKKALEVGARECYSDYKAAVKRERARQSLKRKSKPAGK